MDSQHNTAFQALVAGLPTALSGGICVAERQDIGLVSVMARPGFEAAAALELAGLSHVVSVGPGIWMGAGGDKGAVWGDTTGVALFDQQAAFGVLEIAGPAALRLLQKGVFVDLSVHLAADGASLCSAIARINVILWRLAPERLLVAVPRSFATSFWHWLVVSAAAEALYLGR